MSCWARAEEEDDGRGLQRGEEEGEERVGPAIGLVCRRLVDHGCEGGGEKRTGRGAGLG